MPLQHLSPQLALVVGAAASLVFAMFAGRARQYGAAVIAGVALVAAFVLQLDMMIGGDQILTLDDLWALDHVTGIATLVIVASTLVVVLLSPGWFASDVRHGELYSLLLFAATGATVMAAAADLNELIVGVTLSSVTGYVLSSWHRADHRSVEAGIKYFLVGGLANVVLLIGAVLLFSAAGSTLYRRIGPGVTDARAVLLLPASALLVTGLSFKAGAFPAQGWLPDVAEGAPAPMAALLTVVPKIGGLVAIARIVDLLPTDIAGWRPMVAVLAVITMTIGNLGALHQQDVRRLLGWSSISQSGYALMAVAAIGASTQAVPALLGFLAAYAAGNLTCFAVIVALRGRTDLSDYRGLARERPLVAAAMTIGMLSLIGIPPLVGFAGKFALFTATVDAGLVWVTVAAVLNTVVSLVYYLRVISVMVADHEPGTVATLGRPADVGVGLAVAITVAAGPLFAVILNPATEAVLLP